MSELVDWLAIFHYQTKSFILDSPEIRHTQVRRFKESEFKESKPWIVIIVKCFSTQVDYMKGIYEYSDISVNGDSTSATAAASYTMRYF